MIEINTDLAVFHALLARVSSDPAAFPDTASMARSAGIPLKKLRELLSEHAHLAPESWLGRLRARKAAANLLATRRKLAEIAADAGFANESEFEAEFVHEMRLTPAAYRALGRSTTFQIPLPKGYRPGEVLAYHARDPEGLTERSAGNQIWKALTTADGPVVLQLTLGSHLVSVQVNAERKIGHEAMAALHSDALHMLGLVNRIDQFERQHAAFVKPRRGLRLPLIPRGFDALCWAITGQQINLAFATALRRAMIGLAGAKVGHMITHPTAAALANITVPALAALRYSGSKARYLIDAAGAVANGELDIENLTLGSAVAAQEALISQRGVGIWTARYVLMRRGFADSAPVGDSALATALQRLHALAERPDAQETERLMSRFAPNRSLASMHLWTLLKEARQV
ncbi:MAG: helix-turn-helix domain-containing protein [Proteobacteria bacterium]|nr:helix-turn-helix domain-containing protein [Pseudomonadota bacterium]